MMHSLTRKQIKPCFTGLKRGLKRNGPDELERFGDLMASLVEKPLRKGFKKLRKMKRETNTDKAYGLVHIIESLVRRQMRLGFPELKKERRAEGWEEGIERGVGLLGQLFRTFFYNNLKLIKTHSKIN